MDQPTLTEFHLAMYSRFPGISFESCVEMYLELYPTAKEPNPEPTETESKPKKKSKK
jgi:hypothetical protein